MARAHSIMHTAISGAALVALAALPSLLRAQTPDPDAVAQRLQEAMPKTRFDSIKPAPIPGLYELVVGSSVVYSDASGRYLLFGRIWDSETRQDISPSPAGSRAGAARGAKAATFDLTSLPPLSQAITTVHGQGRRVLHVFADPRCGYCKQLEQDLVGLDDVTVHTWMLPILGDASQAAADAVWCAPDRQRAWQRWMHDNVPPPDPVACRYDAAAVLDLAQQQGIRGTPTLVFADGSRVAGALPAEQINARLNAVPPSAPAVARTTQKTKD